MKYWKNVNPPVHRMIAAFLGIKPKQKGNIEELAKAFGVEVPRE